MFFARVLMLLGVMMVIGGVQVTQQTSLRMMAYRLGAQQVAAERLRNDIQWVRAEVMGLQGPAQLVRAALEMDETLVARVTFQTQPELPQGSRRPRLARALGHSGLHDQADE